MAKNYSDYVVELVEKLKTYTSPTDAQKLIILLNAKSDITNDEKKNLKILVNAERKLEQLNKARQAARDVLKADQTASRKIETRKKILWGAALQTAAKENPNIAKLAVYLYENNYIADKDKNAVLDDYNTAKSKIPQLPQAN